MTVTSETRSVSYTDVGQTVFTIPFRFLEASHIVATITLAGITRTLTRPADFNVIGMGSATGTLTLAVALVAGETLLIERVLPLTQPASLRTAGRFAAGTHENALDRLTMIAQQIADTVGAGLAGLTTETDRALAAEAAETARALSAEAALAVSASQGQAGGNATLITAVGSLTARTLSARSADVVNVRDFGAIGDGVTDDYAAIQAAVARINSLGGGTLVFPRGTYKVNQYRIDGGAQANGVTDFLFSGVNGLVVEGNGSKLDITGSYTRSNDNAGASYRNTVGLVVWNSSRVTIRDLEIDGNSDDTVRVATAEGITHALRIQGCSDVLVQNVQGHHYPSDGLYIGEGGVGPIFTATRRVTVVGSHFHHNGRQALTISVLRGAAFINSTFSDSGRGAYGGHAPQAGVDIEPNRAPSNGTADEYTGEITFTGCTFSNNVGAEFISSGAAVSTLYPITATGCRFIGGGAAARVMPGSRYAKFYGCLFKDVEFLPAYGSGITYPTHVSVLDSIFENSQPDQRLINWEQTADSSLTVSGCRIFATSVTAFTPSYRIWALSTSPSRVLFSENKIWIAGTEHNAGGGAMNLANFQATGCEVVRNEWNTDLGAGANYFRIAHTNARATDERYLGVVGSFSPSSLRTLTGFTQGRVAAGLLEVGDGNSTYNGTRTQRIGTAAPTVGTFLRGDICWNSNPLTTGALGWVCTTAGTDAGAVWTTLHPVGMVQAAARADAPAYSGVPAALADAASRTDLNALGTIVNDLLAKMRTAKLLA